MQCLPVTLHPNVMSQLPGIRLYITAARLEGKRLEISKTRFSGVLSYSLIKIQAFIADFINIIKVVILLVTCEVVTCQF